MYKIEQNRQICFSDFNQSCGMQLNQNDEWVKLANIIPWAKMETKYSNLFAANAGREAISFRMAFGAMIIKQRLGISDRDTLNQLTENPYYQYFIGLHAFQSTAPFHHSRMTAFRKRLTPEIVNECNEMIIEALNEAETKAAANAPKKRGPKEAQEQPDDNGNLGTAIYDATCAPTYIRYPQDFSLLNEARVNLEKMIDWFCEQYGLAKPRTYRRVARKEYLALAKTKKRSDSKIRSTIRKMLGYVHRDLGYLEEFMSEGYSMDKRMIEKYLVILTLYDQQKYMWDNKTHRVDNRIVSLSQPWIRPIVRGKAKAPTEFGPKFEIETDDGGYARIHQCSFDAFNESEQLQDALQKFHDRTGHWPKRVLADQIYRTKPNRAFCKERGIRMSGPKLGRPSKDEKQSKEDKRIAYKDNTDRIGVERYFSLGKRRNGMGLIYAKLETTQVTTIALSVVVTNLFRHKGVFSFFYFYFVPVQNDFGTEFAVIEDDEQLAG